VSLLSGIMLSVVMLSVVILNAIILSFVAPYLHICTLMFHASFLVNHYNFFCAKKPKMSRTALKPYIQINNYGLQILSEAGACNIKLFIVAIDSVS